jgi:hypothetical protein
MASIVGSSWNSAEISGEAPIRSPADAMIELRTLASALRMLAAKKSALPTAPNELEVVAMLPWKSLITRICSGPSHPLDAVAAVGSPTWCASTVVADSTEKSVII